MTTQTRKSIRPALTFACLLMLGGLIGVTAGACNDDDDDGIGAFGEQTCRDYCDRAVDCDDEKSRQDCIDKCVDRMSNCQADEQDAAFDQLSLCAKESCDDFVGCTINAGATCYFGL